MKEQLQHVYEYGSFTTSEAKKIMLNITAGKYSNEEVAAFLMALNMRNLVVDELVGFREAMLERALQYDFSDYNTVDIVGTGGDGKNTFNISTCTSFVVAGAGYKVAKHGSYAVSSISGSANVLMELGIQFSNDEQQMKQCLEEANITFLFAPLFHPAMKHVVPIRKALRIKTIFNILGPLINPTNPSHSLLGVYSEELASVFSKVLYQTPMNYRVVYSLDGYDEVSLTNDTLVLHQEKREILQPSDFGSEKISQEAIFGGQSVQEAASILIAVLQNDSTKQQKEVVVANAALAIQMIEPEKNIIDCKQVAIESIETGKALHCYEQLRKITNKL